MGYTQPESVKENETPKILQNLRIETNHPNHAGRRDLILINKKKKKELLISNGFSNPVDQRMKIKESKKTNTWILLES